MHAKKTVLSNFSHAIFSQSLCLRPEHEHQLIDYVAQHPSQSMLTRGAGLSYNDSCFNTDGYVIDTQRFNHLISFAADTGVVVCQGGVPINDLFLLHPDFIPPVIPGTVHATVAGSIAHDVHGKNNHHSGSFGHHVLWVELLIKDKKFRCSPHEHQELFYATIAGLGLTGTITQVALQLKKCARVVHVHKTSFFSLSDLTQAMITYGLKHAYQVAWIDLLHEIPRSILSVADYCEPFPTKKTAPFTVPALPFSCIKKWNMKLFNTLFFNGQKTEEQLSLQQFNNPLDKLSHWNRLYGPKGLIQFQAVFGEEYAPETIEHLIQLIKTHQAIPTLAVLKLFTQSGRGLLSFCKPGFTLAIDFIHNQQAINAITAMNQFITEANSQIYLAKDLLLNEQQYQKMYKKHEEFAYILKYYGGSMHSDLSQRLGIIK